MTKIPLKIRKTLERDPRMKVCSVAHLGDCSGRIQWHHVWIYAGRQIQETWAILSACTNHHDLVQSSKQVREAFELISLYRASPISDLVKYPRKNWDQTRKRLETARLPVPTNWWDR